MHADLRITDGVYGILSGSDVQSAIAGLSDANPVGQQSVIEMLESILAEMKRGANLT